MSPPVLLQFVVNLSRAGSEYKRGLFPFLLAGLVYDQRVDDVEAVVDHPVHCLRIWRYGIWKMQY